MNADELNKLINLAMQLTAVAVSQYQKYQEEKGLSDAEMKQHLKDLNKEDADALDRIIAAARKGQGNEVQPSTLTNEVGVEGVD